MDLDGDSMDIWSDWWAWKTTGEACVASSEEGRAGVEADVTFAGVVVGVAIAAVDAAGVKGVVVREACDGGATVADYGGDARVDAAE